MHAVMTVAPSHAGSYCSLADSLTIREAARLAGVSTQRVDQFIRMGRLQYIETCWGRRVVKTSLRHLLAAPRSPGRPRAAS